jgi:hypothetical protein
MFCVGSRVPVEEERGAVVEGADVTEPFPYVAKPEGTPGDEEYMLDELV